MILDKLKNDVMNDLNNEVFELAYRDRSGANRPELLENMIPIKYDGNNWIYADIYEEWYNYEAQEWANAVVLNDNVTKNVGDTITEEEIALWYAWIPRYKYQLFNANNGSVSEQLINVIFESGTAATGTVSCIDAVSATGNSSETCTNASNGNWYTHPAFTFGDEELTGLWVGKFEVSGTTDNITIKPGVTSLRNITVSAYFTAIQNMKNVYNLSGDSHMMKNMEWGAVAYLKQSAYGLGTADTVMGNMVNSSGAFDASSSGFSSAPDTKYYDAYTYGTSYTDHGRGKLGDATKETLAVFGSDIGGWHSDYAYFVYSNNSWFGRGGDYSYGSNAGVLFCGITGGGNSTRVSSRAVLVP